MAPTTYEIDFGNGLNIERAEEAVKILGAERQPNAPVVLNLSRCEHIDIGAGWRLGNAMRRFAGKTRLSAIVPDPPEHLSGWWFRNYTRSAIGFAIAKHAKEVVNPQQANLTNMIRTYYSKPRTVSNSPATISGCWTGRNFVLIPDLHDRSLSPDDEQAFRDALVPYYSLVNFDRDAYPSQTLDPITRMLYEAVQNVYDHAARAPLAGHPTLMSYLLLGYYKTIQSVKGPREFTDYAKRVAKLAADEMSYRGFLEAVVNDDGMGVAARHALDPEIYRQSYDDEGAAMLTALRPGQSVKLRSRDAPIRGTPGYGSVYILDALRQTSAFALLRTGRAVAFYDGTAEQPGFSLLGNAIGYMPGTTLQIVLPIRRRTLFGSA